MICCHICSGFHATSSCERARRFVAQCTDTNVSPPPEPPSELDALRALFMERRQGTWGEQLEIERERRRRATERKRRYRERLRGRTAA
jgi:hypothetical protein